MSARYSSHSFRISAGRKRNSVDRPFSGRSQRYIDRQKFSVGTKVAATSTIVTVNGARQVVEPGARFPAADPLFVLVAEKPEAKAVVIGVVGGAYSGGDRTTTLKVGRSLTLVNTATGAKYKISLVSVGSGGQAAAPTTKP